MKINKTLYILVVLLILIAIISISGAIYFKRFKKETPEECVFRKTTEWRNEYLKTSKPNGKKDIELPNVKINWNDSHDVFGFTKMVAGFPLEGGDDFRNLIINMRLILSICNVK